MENESVVETKEEHTSQALMERKLIGLLPMFILVLIIVLRISWTLYKSFGQKTRNPQQRRLYAGSRPRPSLSTHEPTIYVSPSNLPPPPKYEFMAPPSYEEVVGVHYPNLQTQQPITQPIATALAQSTQPTTTNNTRTDDSVPTTNDSATTNNAATTNDPVVRVHETVVVTVNERQTATTS